MNKHAVLSAVSKSLMTGLMTLMFSFHVNADDGADSLFQPELPVSPGHETQASLHETGMTFEVAYTGEYWRNTSGGLHQENEYLDNIDIILTLDAGKLWGLKGGTVFFYVLGNHGGVPADNTGNTQGVSNIAAPDAFKLYEAWYEQRLDDEMSLLFGLYDLNSEFDVIPVADLFIQPSQGIGAEFAQAGENGPSIFPTTSIGLRLRSALGGHGYAMMAVWDGVPGEPGKTEGTHIEFDSDDGILSAVEGGVVIENAAARGGRPDMKVAIGAWRFSEEFGDLSETDAFGNPVMRNDNRGAYLLGEYAVTREAEGPAQGLSIFARIGTANENINQLSRYVGYGMVYKGLFPDRDGDQLGLSVAIAYNGDKYKQLAGAGDRETVIELTYRMPVTSWLAIQPDLQYIINPGTDPAINDALVAGLRIDAVI